MARERSDAQLEGCGACDHAKASCEKEEGGHSYARAFTLQRDDVRLADEERLRCDEHRQGVCAAGGLPAHSNTVSGGCLEPTRLQLGVSP